uniref:Ig-like domain-containing protein n=1 Tax=Cyprinus carpio TaxID=7962 RepID=A0A8C1YL68_CYPCA
MGPSVLMAVKGSDVQLNCTHKKDSTFVQMYWYRQRPGQTMTLIVFTSSLSNKHDYGESDPNKFPVIKTVPESGSLTVNNVESDDSAVYFCSVSKHTVLLQILLILLLELAFKEPLHVIQPPCKYVYLWEFFK